tara:strand:- start:479 stop:781 length:303 start_codon:yes stop_codon:yes gene_type:complete
MKSDHKDWAVYIMGLLILIIFLQTCGTKSVIRDMEDYTANKMDSLSKLNEATLNEINAKILDYEQMVELIKNTPAWKTLRIEEISDKERISINALEEKNK